MKLPSSFYARADVVQIAKDLLGKWLFTKIGSQPLTGGMIIETEAYAGPHDRASHAYNMRRTKRTEVMYQHGGVAYVYLCYGIHYLLNIVTNIEDEPHAVLIRAILPTHGLDTMRKRRGKNIPDHRLASGPGSTAQALGINHAQNGISLSSSTLWIEDRDFHVEQEKIQVGPRIGVDYAGKDAKLPWRFCLPSK